MIAGPHCYSFFDGNDAFAARGDGEMLAFYLTDFLVRQFDAFVWRPMGLDRHPELRDMIFGNYRSLVYLAQTDDPALDAEAARCAGAARARLRAAADRLRRPRPGARRGAIAGAAPRPLLLEPHLADVRQVAVALGVVDAVADHELVGDLEADPLRLHVDLAPRRLVEQRADLEPLRRCAS